MADTKTHDKINDEVSLNTNEVMHDYEFYLKMYLEDQKMDFESGNNDL